METKRSRFRTTDSIEHPAARSTSLNGILPLHNLAEIDRSMNWEKQNDLQITANGITRE